LYTSDDAVSKTLPCRQSGAVVVVVVVVLLLLLLLRLRQLHTTWTTACVDNFDETVVGCHAVCGAFLLGQQVR
jgi:hypothetical protein